MFNPDTYRQRNPSASGDTQTLKQLCISKLGTLPETVAMFVLTDIYGEGNDLGCLGLSKARSETEPLRKLAKGLGKETDTVHLLELQALDQISEAIFVAIPSAAKILFEIRSGDTISPLQHAVNACYKGKEPLFLAGLLLLTLESHPQLAMLQDSSQPSVAGMVACLRDLGPEGARPLEADLPPLPEDYDPAELIAFKILGHWLINIPPTMREDALIEAVLHVGSQVLADFYKAGTALGTDFTTRYPDIMNGNLTELCHLINSKVLALLHSTDPYPGALSHTLLQGVFSVPLIAPAHGFALSKVLLHNNINAGIKKISDREHTTRYSPCLNVTCATNFLGLQS